MIIPLALLWNVQIMWQKKLAFLGIFFLVSITMVFAITRVAVVSVLTKQPDHIALPLEQHRTVR